MPNGKTPLKELVEQRMAWREFVRLAKMPKDKRPSYRSMGIIYGVDERTIKRWLKRYEEEK